MQTNVNKQFLLLQGMPVIVHTLQVFASCQGVGEIIPVCAGGEEGFFTDLLVRYNIKKVNRIITGGAERQDSVFNGLQAVAADTDVVLVHDGARPLVDVAVINRVINAAVAGGAAIAAVPVKDTIKTVNAAGIVEETLDRSRLYQVQTPQGFRYDVLMKAYTRAREIGILGTDDATLVESTGVGVRVVPGNYENIKITTSEDLILAEAFLTRRSGKCG